MSPVNTYLKCFYSLQRLVFQKAPTNEDLSSCIIQLSQAMIAILKEVQRPEQQTTNDQSNGITQHQTPATNDLAIFERETASSKLAMVGRTMIYLVKALNRLEKCPANDALHDRVVYQMVSIFRTIIDRIQSLGVTYRCIPESNRTKGRYVSAQRRVEGTIPIFDQDDICFDLSHLFVSMLVAMESRKQAHMEITEGAMCCLLKRAGVVLKNFVFDVAYRSWNQDDFASTELVDEELLGMQSEAPYLVWILERTMTVVQGWKTDIAPHLSVGKSADPSTLSNVQTQLQNTLLRAVFQDDAVNFEDCFRAPSSPPLEDGSWPAEVKEDSVIDWYKKEIWRIIGWQELRKHIAFEENLDENCS